MSELMSAGFGLGVVVGEAVVVRGMLNVEEQIERIKQKHMERTKDEVQYLAATLRECGQIGYGNRTPATTLMELFLGGVTDKWDFEFNELFAADADVKNRVYSEVVRRSLRLPTQREKLDLHKVKGRGVLNPQELGRRANQPIPGTGVLKREEFDKKLDSAIDPVISIFQRNYINPGWWGALGTFPVSFAIVSTSPDGERLFVKLSGENMYDWHPDDSKRATQELHKMAKRLIELKAAKPFVMRAKPRTFVVNVRSRSIDDVSVWMTDIQNNPDNLGSRRIDQVGRLVKSYF